MKTINEKLDFTGKTVIVTGGYRGIGLGITKSFVQAGANVAICGRNAQAGEAVAKELREGGADCRFYAADVTKCDDIERFVDAVVKDFGKIDVLINNAGITDHTPSEKVTEEAYDRLMNTNLKGAFFMSNAVAKHMIADKIKGSIVIISSMSAFVVNIPQRQAIYNMSKAALCAMTQSMAVEWAEHGIRVNAICPGYILTEMHVAELSDKWLSMTPMGHFGETEDVGALALFLASDAASYMTGAKVMIDGGYSCI